MERLNFTKADFNGLLRNKELIGSINKDFFFDLVSELYNEIDSLKEDKKELSELVENGKEKIRRRINDLKLYGRIKNQAFPNEGRYIFYKEIDILEEIIGEYK